MMKLLLPLSVVFLFAGCYSHTTLVEIKDAAGAPVSGFPLRFELEEGLEQGEPFRTQSQAKLSTVDAQTFLTATDAFGAASVSYLFREAQLPAWKRRFFGATWLPPQAVDVIPLRPLPKGTRISISTPNP